MWLQQNTLKFQAGTVAKADVIGYPWQLTESHLHIAKWPFSKRGNLSSLLASDWLGTLQNQHVLLLDGEKPFKLTSKAFIWVCFHQCKHLISCQNSSSQRSCALWSCWVWHKKNISYNLRFSLIRLRFDSEPLIIKVHEYTTEDVVLGKGTFPWDLHPRAESLWHELPVSQKMKNIEQCLESRISVARKNKSYQNKF